MTIMLESWPDLTLEDRDAAARAMCDWDRASVAELEEAFCEYTGAAYCVAVGSGTTALYLTLLALGIGPGKTVVVPAFGFAGTALAVRALGAAVRFVDVEPRTFNVCTTRLQRELDIGDVHAVIPVHIHGLPCEMDDIVEMCAARGIPVVEDACQAPGATYMGQHVGLAGKAGCFSLNRTKALQGDEGGLIVTDDVGLAADLRQRREFGFDVSNQDHGQVAMVLGGQHRITPGSAAMARGQLKSLPFWTKAARANAEVIHEVLGGSCIVPTDGLGARHTYHKVRLMPRTGRQREVWSQEGLIEDLRRAGVPAARWQAQALTRHPYFHNEQDPAAFGNADHVAAQGVVLLDERHPLCAQNESGVRHVAQAAARIIQEGYS